MFFETRSSIILPFNGSFNRWTWVSRFLLGSLCCTGSGKEPLERVFHRPDDLPGTEPSVSKYRVEYKALTLTSGLTSSFLHPQPDSWWKRVCSRYARYPTPAPCKTSGQSNLTKGRVATAHGWYCLYVAIGRSFPLKIAPSHAGSGPHLMCGSLGPPESTTQRASRSVQLFLQGSRSWQTDWLTTLCLYACG